MEITTYVICDHASGDFIQVCGKMAAETVIKSLAEQGVDLDYISVVVGTKHKVSTIEKVTYEYKIRD